MREQHVAPGLRHHPWPARRRVRAVRHTSKRFIHGSQGTRTRPACAPIVTFL
jgi:hypothetical protein